MSERVHWRRGAQRTWSTFALIWLAGCGSATDPQTGDLEIAVTTTGEVVDADGYSISIDHQLHPIASTGTVTARGLTPGSHRLELTDVAPNCVLDDENPRRVSVAAGGTTPVALAVTCTVPPPEPGLEFTITPGFVIANDTAVLTIIVYPAPGDTVRRSTLSFTPPGPGQIDLSFYGDRPQGVIVSLIVPPDPILATITATVLVETKNSIVTRTESFTVGERDPPDLRWADTTLATAQPGDSGFFRGWGMHDPSGLASVSVRSVGIVAYDSVFVPPGAPSDFSRGLAIAIPADAVDGDTLRVEATGEDIYGNRTTGVLARMIVAPPSDIRVAARSARTGDDETKAAPRSTRRVSGEEWRVRVGRVEGLR